MDVFFNQVLLHHPACLEPSVRSAMNSMLKGEDFPRNVCFGDGTPIPDDWIAEILRAHLRAAMVFHWMPGDITSPTTTPLRMLGDHTLALDSIT